MIDWHLHFRKRIEKGNKHLSCSSVVILNHFVFSDEISNTKTEMADNLRMSRTTLNDNMNPNDFSVFGIDSSLKTITEIFESRLQKIPVYLPEFGVIAEIYGGSKLFKIDPYCSDVDSVFWEKVCEGKSMPGFILTDIALNFYAQNHLKGLDYENFQKYRYDCNVNFDSWMFSRAGERRRTKSGRAN